MNKIQQYREFLKDTIRKQIDFSQSDQSLGGTPPPLQESFDSSAPRISLVGYNDLRPAIKNKDVLEAMVGRKSRRRFNSEFLSIEELSFLLLVTQGVRNPEKGSPHFRTVPSAGARHSFETYLFINRVETIAAGLYRYLPLTHELVLHYPADDLLKSKISTAVFGQKFVADGAVIFVWTTVPYRMEWRYLEAAHRVILLDCGHVCQNLYLACETIDAGTCAIAAYDQEAMDELLQIDGETQFTIYLAPVGKY